MRFAAPDPHPNLHGFFPDLIDRTKTPTYVVQPDPEGSQDVCILRIKGGPPYEDIAFKVPWLGLRVRARPPYEDIAFKAPSPSPSP